MYRNKDHTAKAHQSNGLAISLVKMQNAAESVPKLLACRTNKQGGVHHKAPRHNVPPHHVSRLLDTKMSAEFSTEGRWKTRVMQSATIIDPLQGCVRHGSWDSQRIGMHGSLRTPNPHIQRIQVESLTGIATISESQWDSAIITDVCYTCWHAQQSTSNHW